MSARTWLLLGTACLLAVAAGRAASQVWPPTPVGQGAQEVAAPHRAEARSQEGAVRAALAHVRLLGSPAMFDSERREVLLARAGVPREARKDFEDGYRLAADALGLGQNGAPVEGELVARTVPVGHRVSNYDGRQAVVQIWTVGLLGVAGATSTLPVQASWSTETITLEWQPEGWRWISLQHQEGPAPVGSAQVPAPPDLLLRHVEEFAEVAP